MATQVLSERFALRSSRAEGRPGGAWWPESRQLGDELGALFAVWPAEAGRISRVQYSPPDWDDHPHSVAAAGRWVKTGCFPEDDTHLLTLSMSGGDSITLVVIPSAATPSAAAEALAAARTAEAA